MPSTAELLRTVTEGLLRPQDMAAYGADDYATWRALCDRQSSRAEGCAARAWREGLAALDCADGVPDLEAASERVRAATGWTLVGVSGEVPNAVFFELLAERRFPVAVALRRPHELDWVEEPDLFHDFFGHVPMLLQPEFASFLQACGEVGRDAVADGTTDVLGRLYWYTVEFGLVRDPGGDGGLRIYGASPMSSRAEMANAMRGRQARRLEFDLERVLRTEYSGTGVQPTYFVVDGYDQLFSSLRRLRPSLAAARDAAPIPPGTALPGDVLVPCPGSD
jgi:phenylalanine-4-hydroxylase